MCFAPAIDSLKRNIWLISHLFSLNLCLLLQTATLYPGVVFGICFVLNCFIWGKHSSGAVGTTFILEPAGWEESNWAVRDLLSFTVRTTVNVGVSAVVDWRVGLAHDFSLQGRGTCCQPHFCDSWCDSRCLSLPWWPCSACGLGFPCPWSTWVTTLDFANSRMTILYGQIRFPGRSRSRGGI